MARIYNLSWTPDESKIKELIQQGWNTKEIAEEFGITHGMMRYYIHDKLEISTKDNNYKLIKNEQFFDNVDTQEKAYLLGYLLADGCVSIEPKKRNGEIYSYNKRVMFSVSIDDLEVIEMYKKYISPDGDISRFYNYVGAVNRKEQLRFRFSSRHIVDILISKYNIKPRKTYDTTFIFPFETIPQELHRHFIRGFFDGDGWWAKGNVLGFVCTSLPFINQIQQVISYYNPLVTFRIRSLQNKNMITYSLTLNRVNEEVSSMLYEYLYKDAILFLSRKRSKFKFKENTEVSSWIAQGQLPL